MTADQWIDLIKFLTPILIPAIVAGWTVWLQGQQELKRSAQVQEWQEKERRQQRRWALNDRTAEINGADLATHKEIVDEVLKSVLAVVNDSAWQIIGYTTEVSLKKDRVQELTREFLEVWAHITYFNNEDLSAEYMATLGALQQFFIKIDHEDKSELMTTLLVRVRAGCVKLMQMMQSTIEEHSIPKD